MPVTGAFIDGQSLKRLSMRLKKRLGAAVSAVALVGKAQVRIGGTVLCTVTLSKGAGSCTLTARQLRAGGYTIVAVYLGDVSYHSSQSAVKTVKVAA
jgi:hypothetical protein